MITAKMTKDVKYVINLACNIGGIVLLKIIKLCMLSVPIIIFRACKENKVEKYFFFWCMAYNKDLQQTQTLMDLERRLSSKPEDGMVGKIMNECMTFYRRLWIKTRLQDFTIFMDHLEHLMEEKNTWQFIEKL